jgi:hypothetical protein
MPKPVTTTTTDAIVYEKNNFGIHLIDIQDGTRNGVESLITILERLYSDPTLGKHIYMMVDSTKHTLPLTPSIRRVMQLERLYPNHAPLNAAVLINLDFAIMVDTMLTPLRSRNQIRLFTPKDRERAMQWLLARQAINGIKA